MTKKKLARILIDKNASAKEAMRVIDAGSLGIAFVVDKDKKLFGVVTDGDIRRAILRGVNIDKPVKEIANKDPIFVHKKSKEMEAAQLNAEQKAKKRIPVGGTLKVPALDSKGRINDVIFIYGPEGKFFRSSGYKSRFDKDSIKKVLVVGGAGYLGSVLCRKLLNKGYKVKVLDNLIYGDEGIKELYPNKDFCLLKGDIRNLSDVVEGIKDVNAVIHLAAIVGEPACARDPKKTMEINYLAAKMITETCKHFQINRFIFASTCSVYGENSAPGRQLTEEAPLRPVSLYAETKIKCEQSILEAIDENFAPAILRMATLYGYSPHMRFDLVLNFLTAKAIVDKKIPIFGGSQWRPWLHIEDAAMIYINCLEAPMEKLKGKVFNILSENYKIIAIGKIIKSIFPAAQLEISREAADERNYNVSSKKIFRLLKFRPEKKIGEGVIEIKDVIEKGLVTNYKDSKYRTSLPQI